MHFVFYKELFVLGGYCDRFNSSCFKYNFTRNKWSYIASMNQRRYYAACTVFEGEIVVSGGQILCDDLNIQSKLMTITKTNGLIYLI